MNDSGVRPACGVFGIYGHESSSELAYLGLYSLQHRGQEGAGIVSGDGEKLFFHREQGLVSDVFHDGFCFETLRGYLAIGHNRYSTTGSDLARNVQPIVVTDREGPIAIGHNGNLTNSGELFRSLREKGAIFQTSLDSEVILHLATRSTEQGIVNRLVDALSQIQGSYSLVVATPRFIIAARDPMGFRPLCLGKLGNSWVVASESCALDIIDATYVRDVESGEVMILDESGVKSVHPFKETRSALCVFEYIYFSRPDSKIFGECVDKTRRKLGKTLAEEHPADADIVISVPDSSNTAGLGYAQRSGIRFEIGIIRNHYIGRTFIHPSQLMREAKSRIKYNPVEGVIKGRRIVVVEDSIVRGTTFRQINRMLRQAGAKEVHLRISSPPIIHPCFYGMDFPTAEELLASSMSVQEIGHHLGVDSIGYLSRDGMLQSVPYSDADYCHACFSGKYPIPPETRFLKETIEVESHGSISEV